METTMLRDKLRASIFNSLLDVDRENMYNYCEEHAMQRATIIEHKIYKACHDKEGWEEVYKKLNVPKILHAVEKKTSNVRIKTN